MWQEGGDVIQESIGSFLAAAAALGTAAYGLVDASKALRGGVSNLGFRSIATAVTPLIPGGAGAAFTRKEVLATLEANWLNGVAKADQKAAAKSLIRLGVTPASADALARATGIDPPTFKALAVNIAKGKPLTPAELTVLGRFDTVVSASLDAGYERADQQYRTGAKLVAAVVAVALALVGGGILFFEGAPGATIGGYLASRDILIAFLVGLMATPLAPIAKDLTSSLAAAVKAISSVRR